MKPNTTDLLKFKGLMRRLGESQRGCVGLLELLWIGTAKNAPRGDIGRFSNEEIAIMCDWEGDPDSLVKALVDSRWIDADPVHRLLVHDWEDHCPDYIKGNLKRWNKDFARQSTIVGYSEEHRSEAAKQPPSDGTSFPSLTLPIQVSVPTEQKSSLRSPRSKTERIKPAAAIERIPPKFSLALREAACLWLTHKGEAKKNYTPTGLGGFFTELAKVAKDSGESVAIARIEAAIGNGSQGWNYPAPCERTSRGSPSSRIHCGPGQVFQGAKESSDEF